MIRFNLLHYHSDLNEMMQFKNPLISFSSEDEELLSPERRSFSEGNLLGLKGTINFFILVNRLVYFY